VLMKQGNTHKEEETTKPVQKRAGSQVTGRETKMTNSRLKRSTSRLSLELNSIVTANR